MNTTSERYTAEQMSRTAEVIQISDDDGVGRFDSMVAAMLRQAATDATRIATLEAEVARAQKGWDQTVEALDAASVDAERIAAAEADAAYFRGVLQNIRDSTFRNSVTLRGMAGDALALNPTKEGS